MSEKEISIQEIGLPLYHGTTERNFEVISKEGLKPGNKFVYVEDNPERAMGWAERMADIQGDYPILMKIIDVPRSCRIYLDEKVGKGAYKLSCNIPPESILLVEDD